jgi:hypothetical protein
MNYSSSDGVNGKKKGKKKKKKEHDYARDYVRDLRSRGPHIVAMIKSVKRAGRSMERR